MKLFRKVKGFLLGKKEVDIISGQVYNYVVKKKLVFISELSPFFKRLSTYDKFRILEHLKKEKDIVFEEDMVQYQEKESFGTFSQQQMLNALIKPEFVDTKPSYVQVSSKFYQGLTCVGCDEDEL